MPVHNVESARRQPDRIPWADRGRLGGVVLLAAFALLVLTSSHAAAGGPRGSAFPPLRVADPRGGGELVLTRGGVPSSVAGGEISAAGPSRRKTILLSAAVPGLGQLLHGRKTSGTLFLLGDVAAWTAFFTFRVQGNLREDRFVEYAQRFAGVQDAGGQPDSYYGYLARYDRSGEPGGPDSYNEVEVRRVARELYPDDVARQEEYIRENSISGPLAWDWESDARRSEYEQQRIASETAYHRSEIAVGALVAGRILSVMHAIWFTAEPEEEAAADAVTYQPFAAADLASGESRVGVRLRF